MTYEEILVRLRMCNQKEVAIMAGLSEPTIYRMSSGNYPHNHALAKRSLAAVERVLKYIGKCDG